MSNEINTTITIGEAYRDGLGNLTLEDAKFFGRPNFSGEMDRFKDDRRKFTVLIPNDAADELRPLGWNVKTTIPSREGEEPVSHLKVMLNFKADPNHPGEPGYERGPDVWVIQGEAREKLTSQTVGILDRSRIESMDMEIRAWNYNAQDVAENGDTPEYSARLVQMVVVLRPDVLAQKYGGLI